jgi:FAD/FMN-containing dehydrogenase
MISRRTLLGAGVATLGLAALPTVAVGRTDWDELACRLRGSLVLPSDRGYATAKQLELAQFDGVGPSAIAYCVSAGDVSSAVRFARHHGVPVAVRSGGHSFGGYSTTTGLVVDVSRLNEVTVGGSVVTIGPGAQNAQILGALAPYGLVVSEGGCPTVAAGGFLQGGGYGFLTRPLGMACDAIVSAEVVLADGSIVTASRDEHPDLFWAIRGGGGGNFGIVTSFRVVPHDGDTMSSSTIVFPYSAAAGVLAGFSHWLADAPRSIGGGAFVQQADAGAGSAPNLVVLLASPGTPAALSAEIDRLLAATGAPLVRQDAVSSFRDR